MLDEEQLVDRLYQIDEIIRPTDRIAVLTLDRSLDAKPGQFIMLTIPEIGQKPISISQTHPLELAVKFAGPFTKQVYDLEPGADVLVRGPIGSGVFPVDGLLGNVYLIGGGMGTSPLRLLAKNLVYKGKNVESFLGAGNGREILFGDDFEVVGKVHVSTDDGSKGYHGTIVNLLRTERLSPNSSVAICGPERMIVAVVDLLMGLGFDSTQIYLSLERYMKCGMGICGNCESDGYRVCQDGPVFPYSFIEKNLPSFGLYRRNKTGTLVII